MTNHLKQYDVEFVKLNEGTHQFDFEVDNTFFKAFESSLTAQNLNVKLHFTKATNMFTLLFEVQGIVNVECDRCLKDIHLPIRNKQSLMVKVTEFAPEEEEDDLVYILPSEYKLNIAQHLFDFILLSIPIKKVCKDTGETCDTNITDRITGEIDVELEIEPTQDTDNELEEEDII